MNGAKQAAIKNLSKLSEDTGHLFIDSTLFKTYFGSIAKEKYDDIARMIGSIEIKEQNFKNVTFMNLKIEPRISSKAMVNFDKPLVDVRGLPVTMEFMENDITVTFDCVSAKFEVPTEQGAITFGKMPI